jgi:hypothetical protein
MTEGMSLSSFRDPDSSFSLDVGGQFGHGRAVIVGGDRAMGEGALDDVLPVFDLDASVFRNVFGQDRPVRRRKNLINGSDRRRGSDLLICERIRLLGGETYSPAGMRFGNFSLERTRM